MEEPEYNALPAEFETRMREKREASRRARDERATAEPTRFGAYRLLEFLGEGPAARVHLAEGPDGAQVALKILRRSFVRDVEREGARAEYLMATAERLKALRHPHVVSILDVIAEGGETALVLELCEESTLDELLRRRPVWPWSEALVLGERLCEALECLHAGGIVHDDIKPRNIFIDANGAPRLADPNSAREIAPSMSERAVALSGSPQFMAPERLRGEPASERSDVYALAVVLFRLISGQLPIKGPLVAQLREAQRSGRMAPLSSPLSKLPDAVSELLRQGLSIDPTLRIASASEFRARIAAAQTAVQEERSRSRWPHWLRRLLGQS